MLLLIGGHPFANGAEPLRQHGGEPLKIITHNVLYGFTQRTSPRYENWKAWMKSQTPDVVCLQELTGYTAEKLASDAATWGHSHSELLKTDGFPTGITSRFPITHVERIREGFHHGLLRCQIKGIWFYVIHFHPSNFARRVEEAALLAKDVCVLPERNPRIILAGDFNGFSPADKAHYDNDSQLVPFFQMLDRKNKDARNLNDGHLGYGGLQAILDLRYIDLIDRARDPGSQFIGTFPAKLVSDENHGTDRRLDYIFVTPNLIDSVETAAILREDVTEQLSDHIPVTVTLRLDDGDGRLLRVRYRACAARVTPVANIPRMATRPFVITIMRLSSQVPPENSCRRRPLCSGRGNGITTPMASSFWIATNKTDAYLRSALEKLDDEYEECEADFIDASSTNQQLASDDATLTCPKGSLCFRVRMITKPSAVYNGDGVAPNNDEVGCP